MTESNNRYDSGNSFSKLDLKKSVYTVRLNLLEALGTPRALSLAICYRYGEYETLYDLLSEPFTLGIGSSTICAADTADIYRVNLQTNALFSKADDLPPIPGLEDEALEGFLQCEKANRETNVRFLTNQVRSDLIFTTSMLISQTLGKFDIDRAHRDIRFGPGVSSTCRGLSATIAHKLESPLQCTPRAAKHLVKALESDFQYLYCLKNSWVSEPYNYFLTIPKTFKELRGICIGQHGNIMLQLGVGTYMRTKFRKYVDLDRQADFHRKLVRESWRKIATIDLRKASQLIARRCVQSVFPTDWLSYMDDIREEYTLLPSGDINYNQHYSAMGNGFTFEMESILFYNLAKAAMLNAGVKWDILTVFGDDIIVDREHAHLVVDALENFGFQINRSKTFIDGPFKESCGEDTFNGIPVRPFYLRNINNGKPVESQYRICNNILRMALRSYAGICFDSRFFRSWVTAVRSIPEKRRHFTTNVTSSQRNRYGSTELFDDQVLYRPGGRLPPEGSVNQYRIGRKFRSTAGYTSLDSDIQLGAALLGCSSSGEIPRGLTTYQVARRKLKYTPQLTALDWGT